MCVNHNVALLTVKNEFHLPPLEREYIGEKESYAHKNLVNHILAVASTYILLRKIL